MINEAAQQRKKERNHKYRLEHKEYFKDYARRWNVAHPEKLREYRERANARKRAKAKAKREARLAIHPADFHHVKFR
jgi:hypothetical protein